MKNDIITTPLYANDTIVFTFSSLADLSVSGLYNFEIYADFIHESDRSDDTLKTSINICDLSVNLGADFTKCENAINILNAGSGAAISKQISR